MEINNMRCCGIKEISGLSLYDSPKKALKAFGERTYNRTKETSLGIRVPDPLERFRYVVFSQANAPAYEYSPNRSKYGEKLAELIEKENLGSLVYVGPHVNPNSNNYVRVWIWTIDHDRTKAFITELGGK